VEIPGGKSHPRKKTELKLNIDVKKNFVFRRNIKQSNTMGV
jgi:hypothetical protein